MYKLKFHEPQANLPIYWYQVMKFHPKINTMQSCTRQWQCNTKQQLLHPSLCNLVHTTSKST